MSFVSVPAYPSPSSVSVRLISSMNELKPTFGGPVQRVSRPGSRFAIDVTLPPMTPETARPWLAILAAGSGSSPIRMPFPQGRTQIGAPGSPVVNGAGQAGMSLSVRGVTPAFVFPAGHAFTIMTNGQPYNYMLTESAVASGGGVALLKFGPMLRRPPADGDQVLIAQPVIEGWAFSGGGQWSIDTASNFGLEFTLAERD